MSVAMWNCHSWPLDVSSSVKFPFGIWGGPSAKLGLSAKLCVLVHLQSCVYQYSRHLCSITWGGSISQSRFVYQVCTGIQGISGLLPGGPLAKVGSSAKFCVPVFKASLLNYWGDPSAKVCLPAKFSVVVFKASILDSPGGSISQSRFVCQFLCTGMQGISALLPRGVYRPKYVHLPSLV